MRAGYFKRLGMQSPSHSAPSVVYSATPLTRKCLISRDHSRRLSSHESGNARKKGQTTKSNGIGPILIRLLNLGGTRARRDKRRRNRPSRRRTSPAFAGRHLRHHHLVMTRLALRYRLPGLFLVFRHRDPVRVRSRSICSRLLRDNISCGRRRHL